MQLETTCHTTKNCVAPLSRMTYAEVSAVADNPKEIMAFRLAAKALLRALEPDERT